MNSWKNDQSFLAGVLWLPLIVTIILAIGLLSLTGAAEGRSAIALAAGSSRSPNSSGATALFQSAQEGEKLFQEKCAACHTIGQGTLVGPDLQGVTTQRERDWLARWIKEPDKMLAEGDPIATQLLQEFNNVPMPNLGLTEQQVEALIAYLQTTETSATTAPLALPALYVPTLVASLIALAALTALGLIWGRKQVEVRL